MIAQILIKTLSVQLSILPLGFSISDYLGITDGLLIIATLLGPVLAVQAQKWLERLREVRNRREQVFKVLMATRAAKLTMDHAQALNMIDIEFIGKKYAKVREAWSLYRDHLSPTSKSESEAQLAVWTQTADDLFTNLLFEMSQVLGYTFDRVTLKRAYYLPTFLSDMDQDLTEIRKSLRSLLTGKHALKMDVVSFPELEDSDSQKALVEGMNKLLGRAEGLENSKESKLPE